MSNTWRERVQRAKKRLMESLGLSEEDWQYYQDHIGNFCSESDSQVRLVYGENCNVDKVVEKMTESEFLDMSKEVIKDVFEKLGYKKKKKKKKPNEPEETDDQAEVLGEENVEGETEEEVQQEMEIVAN